MKRPHPWRRTTSANPSASPAADPAVEPLDDGAATESEHASAPEVTTLPASRAEDVREAEAGTVATLPPLPKVQDPASSVSRWAIPALLLRAAHPIQGLITAVLLAFVAALAGRPAREVALVLVTVLVGQPMLGWFNDLVDRQRDAEHQREGKPLSDGRLEPGTVWFAFTVGVLLVVPLSISGGAVAGVSYLISLGVGLLGNVWTRRGVLSFVPWMASFALYPAFISYGGWGGQDLGDPPRLSITLLFALTGLGVHLARSVWGLVPDHEDGWQTLPLRLGLRLGAPRLLLVASAYLTVVVIVLIVVAATGGLAR